MVKPISTRPVAQPQSSEGSAFRTPIQDPRLEAYIYDEQRQADVDFSTIILAIVEKARRGNSGRSSRVQAVDKPSTPYSKTPGVPTEQAASSISAARQGVVQVSGPADKVDKLGEDMSRNRGLLEYV